VAKIKSWNPTDSSTFLFLQNNRDVVRKMKLREEALESVVDPFDGPQE